MTMEYSDLEIRRWAASKDYPLSTPPFMVRWWSWWSQAFVSLFSNEGFSSSFCNIIFFYFHFDELQLPYSNIYLQLLTETHLLFLTVSVFKFYQKADFT